MCRDPRALQGTCRGPLHWTHAVNTPEDHQGNTHASLSCAQSLLRSGVRKPTCTLMILEFVPHPSNQHRKRRHKLVQATNVATASTWQVFTWPVAGLEVLLCVSSFHPSHSKGHNSIPISQMTKLKFIEAPGRTRGLGGTTEWSQGSPPTTMSFRLLAFLQSS